MRTIFKRRAPMISMTILGAIFCGVAIYVYRVFTNVPPPPTFAHTRSPFAKVFLERLRAISGKHAKDCGRTSLANPYTSVSGCGFNAFQDHKAFFLAYYQDPEVPVFSYGLASNSVGDVFAVTYQGLRAFPAVAPDRHTKLMDNNFTRITQCAKPATLDKTTEGLLVCTTPVNRDESDRVAEQTPVDTTVCTVLENPSGFNNKLVRIRGHFSGNFEYSMLSDDDCSGSLWFEYGDGGAPPNLAMYVSGGARPGSEDSQGKLILPVPVRVVYDAKLKQFEKQTVTMVKADADWQRKHPNKFVGHCVTATFIGRIDGVSPEIHEFRKKQSAGEGGAFVGFGLMGMFEAQLVIRSVVDDAVLGRCKN